MTRAVAGMTWIAEDRAEARETMICGWLDYDLWLGPAPWAPFTANRMLKRAMRAPWRV